MKLLLDINVILDVALKRQPWAADGVKVVAAVENGQATGYVAGHTITTAHYVISKVEGRPAADAAIAGLLRVFEVVPVEKADFYQAAALGLRDFEDAVQAVCALKTGADYIVTRNEKDFQGFMVPARTPGAMLSLL